MRNIELYTFIVCMYRRQFFSSINYLFLKTFSLKKLVMVGGKKIKEDIFTQSQSGISSTTNTTPPITHPKRLIKTSPMKIFPLFSSSLRYLTAPTLQLFKTLRHKVL